MIKKRVLFFYPSNYRAIALETQIRQLREIGLEVYVCTIDPWGDLHDHLDSLGFRVCTLNPVPFHGIRQHLAVANRIFKLAKKLRVNIIISHLQPANLAVCIAKLGFFGKVDIITFRHHDIPQSLNSAIGDKIINLLSPLQVVPARAIASRMTGVEGVNYDRIRILKYSYDFDEYANPRPEVVAGIRRKYGAPLVVVISRMVPEKRHDMLIDSINRLVRNGVGINCLFLGRGREEDSLKAKVKALSLESNITFLGFVANVPDFIAAADIVLHPSVAEASCSAVKEAGLYSVPVIACSGVGDFDEYLLDGFNSLLLSKEAGPSEWAASIECLLRDPSLIGALGRNLRGSVVREFGDSREARNRLRGLIASSTLI